MVQPALKRAVEEARRGARATPADPGREDGLSPPEPTPAFLPVHVAEVTTTPPPARRSGVEVVLGSGCRTAVEAGFAQLTAEKQEVILMARLMGLPMAEIAQEMGKTEGAVRTMLSRALAELAESL